MNESAPSTMAAVQLVGHGGIDMLRFREDVPTPVPGHGEVLIRVAAAGINNTDINTRIGWYSKAVSTATEAGGSGGLDGVDEADASWSGVPMTFPRIQGADCCGRIVAVGEDVDEGRLGERVIVQAMQRDVASGRSFECRTFGSECDGAFAQYAKAPSAVVHKVECDWSDAELASIPCAWSTAENMLHRAAVGAGDRVLVTGASGGVGSAAVQLARRRGAQVIAVAGASKAAGVRELGASEIIDRRDDLVEALGRDSVDAVMDLVAGPAWPMLLDVLRRGGRYAVSGAIAGPLVELDVRTLYLKDLTFFGCTFQEDVVFGNLVGYIERGEIRPIVAGTFPLAEIGAAQTAFLAKDHVGKLVLVPPA